MPEDQFSYVYNYTDHLGNIRLSYAQDPDTQQLKIVEQNHYYPFGLRHTNYSGGKMQVVKEQEFKRMAPTPEELLSYKYKYNGKEWQDELGLNLYDYGARNYDAAIGRWMNIDPKAETSRRWNPYTYCYNNPLRFVDPDGMEAIENDDWVMREDRSVYWDDKATSDSTTKSGETYLGKEVSYKSERGTTVNLHSDKTWDEQLVFATVDAGNTASINEQGEAVTQAENSQTMVLDQEKVDLAAGSAAGVGVIFEAATKHGDMLKASRNIGIAGTVVSAGAYINAVATDQAKTSHHVDAAISATLLTLSAIPVTAPFAGTAALIYGVIRIVAGEAIDNWINNE
ncbi:MAG: RHS repeat-associated core domain-containing protein [Microcystis sp. LE19-338.1B]|nr:RHS repeat-associated core domain-containing protein [Microcystis sp. LE19-338.1B]